jgi:hypothetical protein
MKKIAGLIAAGLFIVVGTASVQAAQGGTTCSLEGNSKFKPALRTAPVATKYTFAGKLTDCQSTAGVTSATVKARGAGSLGCAAGSSKGKATIKWNDGKTTFIKYETNDVGAAAQLDGEVTGGSSAAFAKGDTVFGALAFNADAAKCAGDGIAAAKFQGQVGGGSPN